MYSLLIIITGIPIIIVIVSAYMISSVLYQDPGITDIKMLSVAQQSLQTSVLICREGSPRTNSGVSHFS